MKMVKKALVFFCVFNTLLLNAQTGGEHVFPFLDIAFNARSGALGRSFLTAMDDDVNMGVNNPAMFNSEMHHTIGFNQALLAGGIHHGMIAYARDIEGVGTGAAHLRYVSYGQMDRMDVQGNKIGTFSAGDFVLGAGVGHEISPMLRIGANANVIWSQLESFSSLGVSVDFAGVYHNEEARTTVTTVVRNVGAQLTTYTDNERTPLAVNPMLAVAHKLAHAPFRFSIVAHSLNRWDLSYTDPNAQPTIDPLTNEEVPVPQAGFGEKLGRHFIYQVEILAGELLRIRGAFDYQRRREFVVQNRPAMAGFSFGLGMNFQRFSVDYGLVVFSSAGFNNLFTLRTNFDKWKK